MVIIFILFKTTMTKTNVNQTWESPPVGVPLYLRRKDRKKTWNDEGRYTWNDEKTPRLRASNKNANGWEEIEPQTCTENYSECKKVEVPKGYQDLQSLSEWELPIGWQELQSPSECDLPVPTGWKRLQSPSESELPIPTGWKRLQSESELSTTTVWNNQSSSESKLPIHTGWNKQFSSEFKQLKQNTWGLNNVSWDSPVTKNSIGWDA